MINSNTNKLISIRGVSQAQGLAFADACACVAMTAARAAASAAGCARIL